MGSKPPTLASPSTPAMTSHSRLHYRKEKKKMSTNLVSNVRQPLTEDSLLAKVAMAIAARNGEQVIWQCYISDARAAVGAMAEAIEEALSDGDRGSIRELVDSAVCARDSSHLRDQPRSQ